MCITTECVKKGSLLFKGCDLAATAGLGVTTAGLTNPAPCARYQLLHNRVRNSACARVKHRLFFQPDCYCTVVHQRRVRTGEGAKVCGGQALLCSAAIVEKQHIFLFRLQQTRHRYCLAHSTAHTSSGQSTK